MINKLFFAMLLAFSLDIHGVHYGSTQEFYRAYQGPYYGGQDGDYHIVYMAFQNRYFQGGKSVAYHYCGSLQEAIKFANTYPEITHFYFVGPEGIWETQGADYASDSYLVHQPGYAEFFSGSNGTQILYEAKGTHVYYKQSVVRRPENYVRNDLITYLKNNPDLPREDDTYFQMPVTLQEAYELADSDPTITHFMILQYDNQFADVKLSKDQIVFFRGALPSWLSESYNGRIFILIRQ